MGDKIDVELRSRNVNADLGRLCPIIHRDIDVPEYEGDYEVTPTFEDIVLLTQDKRMTDNLTVKEIPVHTVSNLSGGYTITIGDV